MIYKKIDITQAALSNIDEGTAQEFIDHRINLKKPLTQGAFNRAVKAAVKCEAAGICQAQEAVETTIDKGWLGVTPEYLANHFASRQQAAIESLQVVNQPRLTQSTKAVPIAQELNDHSWAH